MTASVSRRMAGHMTQGKVQPERSGVSTAVHQPPLLQRRDLLKSREATRTHEGHTRGTPQRRDLAKHRREILPIFSRERILNG